MNTLPVRRDVLLAATHHLNQNGARYYFMLRMLCTRPHPDGKDRLVERCCMDDVLRAQKELGRRDGKITLERLIKMGWVRDGNNGWYYFTSQDKIAKQYKSQYQDTLVDYRTAEVEASKLRGNVVKIRAYFYSLAIAGMSESNTFTRSTIKKVTGHVKKTQRKYEKIEEIKHEENVGLLHNNLIQPTDAPIFETKDTNGALGKPGAIKSAYQMANTYQVDKSTEGTKRVRLHRDMPTGPQKLRYYFPKAEQHSAEQLGEKSGTPTYTYSVIRSNGNKPYHVHQVYLPNASLDAKGIELARKLDERLNSGPKPVLEGEPILKRLRRSDNPDDDLFYNPFDPMEVAYYYANRRGGW